MIVVVYPMYVSKTERPHASLPHTVHARMVPLGARASASPTVAHSASVGSPLACSKARRISSTVMKANSAQFRPS